MESSVGERGGVVARARAERGDRPTVDAPFFIVGSGRSGTTLLRLILAGHSRVTIPPESWFLLPLVEELPLLDPLAPDQVERAIELATGHWRWPDLEIDDAVLAREIRALDRPTLRAIADLVFGMLRDRAGMARWGDKTPRYVAILPEIARLYPEARFIHLVRDGHDVALSMYLRRWWGRWLAWHTDEWTEAIEHMERNRRRIAPERLLEVRYEDLVLDTETVVRRICAFLGETFEPAMLRWEDSVADKIPKRELHMHQKLARRPRPDDVHRWKRELSAGQVLVVESLMGRQLEKAGYEVRFGGPVWAPLRTLVRWKVALLLPVLDVLVRAPGAVTRRIKWGLGLEERPTG